MPSGVQPAGNLTPEEWLEIQRELLANPDFQEYNGWQLDAGHPGLGMFTKDDEVILFDPDWDMSGLDIQWTDEDGEFKQLPENAFPKVTPRSAEELFHYVTPVLDMIDGVEKPEMDPADRMYDLYHKGPRRNRAETTELESLISEHGRPTYMDLSQSTLSGQSKKEQKFMCRWVRKNCRFAATPYNKAHFENELLTRGFQKNPSYPDEYFKVLGSPNHFPHYVIDVALEQDGPTALLRLEDAYGSTPIIDEEDDVIGKAIEWENRVKEWDKFEEAVTNMGFSCTGTGGGCTALELELDDGYRILLTNDDLSEPDAFDPVNFGLYDPDGNDVEGYTFDDFPKVLAVLNKWIAGKRPSTAPGTAADECNCDMQHLLHKGHEEGCPFKKDLPMVGAKNYRRWVMANCAFAK